MVSKPKAKAQAKREKPKVENKKRRNSARGNDAELFRAVVEHSHDAIIFLDSERRIFYASPSIAQISGYEPEELIGRSGIEFNHPDDREATTRKFLDLLQNPGKSISIENRLKHKNGSWYWVNTTATNFLDHPQVQAVVLNMRDITERRKTEDALRVSDERYRSLFSNSMDAVLLTTPDGSILEANPAACEMFGRSVDELISGGRISIVDISDPRLKPALEERARTGKFKGELTFLRKDGSKFPGEVSTQIFTDQSGQNRTSMVIRDITERKRAEEELRENEETTRLIVDSALDALITMDQDGQVTRWNDQAEAIFEWTRAEAVGQHLSQLIIPPDLRADHERGLKHYLKTGEGPVLGKRIEITAQRRNGNIFPVELTIHALKTNDKVSFAAFVRDITERKLAEEALRESEERYRGIFQTAAISIWEEDYSEVKAAMDELRAQGVTDFRRYLMEHPDFARRAVQMVKVLDVNESTVKMYGAKDKAELLGSLEKFVVNPDVLSEELIAFAEGKTYFERESIDHRLDGSFVSFWLTITFFTDAMGFHKALVCMSDITARKQAEARQTMLYETLHAVSGHLDADEIARTAVDIIGRLGGWTSVAISLPSADKETWQTRAGYGMLVGEYGEQRPMSKGVIGRTYRTGKTQNVPDVSRDPDYFRGEHPVTRSQLAIPIQGREQILGVVNIESEHLDAFTPADVLLVESFADTVSLALDNTRLYTAAQQEIAERIRAEQALRESEALYRQAIEVAGAVPYYESYYDNGAKIKYDFIGEGIRQITGYGPEEFTAALWDSIILDIHMIDDLAGYTLDEAIQRVRLGESSIWKCEHRIRHRNGEIRWVFEAAVELRDEHGASYGSIGMYQDITARKMAEATLRESQQRLSLFFNQSLDGFFFSMIDEPIEWNDASDKEKLIDYVISHQHITEANNAMIEQYGSAREKFMGRTGSDFFVHDLNQARIFRKSLFDAGHLHLETEERKDDGTPIWIEGDYVCIRDAQNRITGMFGIQRDATSRKIADDVLREAENKYRNLVERLTQVIYTSELGNHGIWSYVSPQIEKLLGFTPQEWLADPTLWYQQVHPEDRDIQLALEEQAYARNEPFEAEYRILTRAGNWIWVRDSGHIVPPQGYGLPIVQGMLVDITERKQAQDALKRSQEDYKVLLNTIDGIVWEADANTFIFSYASQQAERLLGYPIERWTSEPTFWKDHMHPDDQSWAVDYCIACTRDKLSHEFEYRMIAADGHIVWLRDIVAVIVKNDRPVKLRGIMVDITERKQIEIKLHASEDILRSTIESPKEINIVSVNRDYEYLSFNTFHKDSMKQAYGIDVKNGMNLLDCILADEECMKVKGFFDRALAGESHTSVEQYGILNIYFWETKYSPIINHNNEIVGATAFSLNITERRQAEDNHRKAEAKYRMLVEQIPPIIYLALPGQNVGVTYISPQIKTLGFTEEEWLADPELWLRQIHPDDQAKVTEYIERISQSGEPYKLEYRLSTRAGVVRWFMDEVKDIVDETGNILFRQGFMLDITERKQSEEALSISKAQLLANLEHTPNVAVQWYDKDGHILYWNPASESMYGWKSIEALGKTLEHLIHTPEEQAEFIRILADIQATGKPYGPYEARVRRKDDTSGWVLATTFSMPMPDGQLGFVCMDVDINERKQAEELIQRQFRRLNALHTIDMAINSSANVQITLEVLLGQTLSQLNADAADVLLFNQPAQTLELTASRGFRSNINLQSQQRLGDGFAGQVINARRTIHISNLLEAGKNLRQMHLLANDSFTEYFGVPLIAKGHIKGVLEIYHRSPLNPEDDWLNFLEVLGGQAAIAIDNSQLVNGLQRSNMELVLAYDATIEGWSRAMDLRDKETEGHTQRVTTLTLKLARAMGIREADIIQIQRGGLLHDIGKLGVPDNILLKPGPLTDDEWAIMRQHPAYAFNMIAPVNYLKPALDIPYCHHEKWDGTGYPRGLQGEQIPLAARIFAVVDVWDALTSDRPYRPAWTKDRTFEHILSLSGTHFDPQVVDAFTELRDRDWQ